MTNRGAGYTSPPTVSFAAGGGTGAAGASLVGLNNTDGNYLTVHLQSSAVLKSGTGNMFLANGDITGNGFNYVVLYGRNGGIWHEVSRT